MTKIPLTQNKFAIVDDNDFDELIQYNWYAHYERGRWYAWRTKGKTKIKMHQQIYRGRNIDHKNHNGLDNRRCNLRLCTQSQNIKNSRFRKNSSGFLGVSWDSKNKKWRGQIMQNYRQIHIGRFNNKEDAAKAVDEKAIELFGDFAILNFPEARQ